MKHINSSRILEKLLAEVLQDTKPMLFFLSCLTLLPFHQGYAQSVNFEKIFGQDNINDSVYDVLTVPGSSGMFTTGSVNNKLNISKINSTTGATAYSTNYHPADGYTMTGHAITKGSGATEYGVVGNFRDGNGPTAFFIKFNDGGTAASVLTFKSFDDQTDLFDIIYSRGQWFHAVGCINKGNPRKRDIMITEIDATAPPGMGFTKSVFFDLGSSDDVGTSIVYDATVTHYFVTGYTKQITSQYYEPFLLELNQGLNVVACYRYNTSPQVFDDVFPYKIHQNTYTPNAREYIIGGGLTVTSNYKDAFLFSVDQNGIQNWMHTFGFHSSYNCFFGDFIIDNSTENIYLTGYADYNSTGNMDINLKLVNPHISPYALWDKSFTHNNRNDISKAIAEINPGTFSKLMIGGVADHNNNTIDECYLIKTDNSATPDVCYSGSPGPNICTFTFTRNTVSVQRDSSTSANNQQPATSTPPNDFFPCLDGHVQPDNVSNLMELGVQQVKHVTPARFDPNPFSEQLSVHYYSTEAIHAELQIFDMNGCLVYTRTMQAKAGMNELMLQELNRLPAGVYHAHLSSAGKTEILKLIRQ